jgi:hypothetical protein
MPRTIEARAEPDPAAPAVVDGLPDDDVVVGLLEFELHAAARTPPATTTAAANPPRRIPCPILPPDPICRI